MFLYCFKVFETMYVPREKNFRAELLSKIASSKKIGYKHIVIQETLVTHSIEKHETNSVEVAPNTSCMMPIIYYL